MAARKKDMLKISKIAREAGVMPSTIRYYTDMGLLTVGAETQGGHRLYKKEETLQVITKIQFLSKQGLSIEAIRQQLLSDMGRKKILVIDDEPEVGELVTSLVAHTYPNCDVKVVHDGFSAGRMLGEYIPDLIVLDIMLPGVNGFDVCRQIKKSEFLTKVKILAVTGYDSDENKKQIMECGANDFLAKPMDLSVLRDKIGVMLSIKPLVVSA